MCRSSSRRPLSVRPRLALSATATAALVLTLPVSAGSPAEAEPTPADGPTPGAPVLIQPGDTFRVDTMRFMISDSRGVASVETDSGGHGETKVHLDSTVLFDKDSAMIRAVADARLAEVARQLQAEGPGRVAVTGYTDDLGSAAHGLTLSRQRAAAVAAELQKVLAPRDFAMTVRGLGEADPQMPNDSEAHRRVNRRVIVDYRPR